MISKIMLLLSSLMLTGKAWAQLSLPSRFDSLTTTAQVQRFVRSQREPEFTLADSVRDDCRQVQACRPALRRSWQKADFDGNGLLDLLVTGHPDPGSARRYTLCYLNLGPRGVKPLLLADSWRDCVVLESTTLHGQALVRRTHFVAQPAENSTPTCRQDTLIFQKTGFIEYNPAPLDYRIRQVAFSTTPCFGTCPIFDLQIAQDGQASYHAERYNSRRGRFTATLNPQALAELWELLSYLDFPKLRDDYSIGATDFPGCTLTIAYGNGQVKTIRDYGEQGTFGLQRLYALLFALRTSQPWK